MLAVYCICLYRGRAQIKAGSRLEAGGSAGLFLNRSRVRMKTGLKLRSSQK